MRINAIALLSFTSTVAVTYNVVIVKPINLPPLVNWLRLQKLKDKKL